MLKDINEEVEKAEPALQEGLNLIDRNKDGYISRDEIVYALKVFKDKLPVEKVDDIIDRLDRDHDGLVSVEELLKLATELHIDLPKAVAEQQEADRVAATKLTPAQQAAAEVAAMAAERKKDTNTTNSNSK